MTLSLHGTGDVSIFLTSYNLYTSSFLYLFHVKDTEVVVVGCGQPGSSDDGWTDVLLPPRGGIAERYDNYVSRFQN